MNKALVKLSWRQVIDANSQSTFEKAVFSSSYNEFLMKSQAYNPEGKFKTFTEMKANDGRANSLHYKSGFAVAGYMETLNKEVPVLQNAIGQTMAFHTYQFEVIESDITNKAIHKVAILYFTDTLTLLENFGDNMLLVWGDKTQQLKANPSEAIENTFLLKIIPGLSVCCYQQIT